MSISSALRINGVLGVKISESGFVISWVFKFGFTGVSLGPPINCKWHIGCGLDGGGVWSLGHVGVSLVYTLRTLNVRADLPSSVKPGILAMRDTEIFILNISLGSYCG
ncbi:hypothetical protein OUZ56_030031 [Daphnia magna]|uniref:Uncharacterized protein n=1 Tax=Daphnia magna TaxID=35525 RepID=A0ABQ9ZQS1_9CRUS|nr:hypothetical protein OUZ56_030031 [Daphnia magna]